MAEEKSGSAAGSGDTHGESAPDGAHDSAGSSGAGSSGAGSSSPGSSGTGSSGAGSSTPTSASEAFHAGREARNSPEGGDGLGPSESPTVEHADTSRTEAMSTSHRPADAPTAVAPTPAPTPAPQRAQAAAERSGPSPIGEAVRKVFGLVATVVTVVGLLCAAVLVVFVVLRIVAINPENAVAQSIGAIADRLVGAFRDLFLIPDPVVGLVVNYGVAAVVWIVATAIVARILRAVGRAIP